VGRLFTLALVLAFSTIPGLHAEGGFRDPAFDAVPFDQWLNETNQAHFHWSVHVSAPVLSAHQRLAVNLDIQVDGADLAKRRGEGRLLVFVQLADNENRPWQNHQEFDLERLENDALKAKNAIFSQAFFAVPGDYQLSAALFDSATGEHSVIQRRLHINWLRHDPFPDLWRDLPAVEFFTADAPPDRWYLPSIVGRLKLAVATRHPMDIDVLVNLTPSERFSASTRVQNRNLDALIPTAKVLSQIDWRDSKLNLELLDLARRRVAYRQDNLRSIDWPSARVALDKANPGIIDVKSLANRRFSADFFINRIARKAVTPKPRVVIILSASVFFEPGVEMRPIELAARPDLTLIYIRYQPRPPAMFLPDGSVRRSAPVGHDELESLLKPLAPRLFEVDSPEQLRRSLAVILDQIAKL
jgi:hypothetical protein